MKVSTTLAALLLTFSVGSAYAATQVDNNQTSQLQSMGSISKSVRATNIDDAVKAIAQQAESQNASYYRVIAANSPDNSNYWHVSAEMYR